MHKLNEPETREELIESRLVPFWNIPLNIERRNSMLLDITVVVLMFIYIAQFFVLFHLFFPVKYKNNGQNISEQQVMIPVWGLQQILRGIFILQVELLVHFQGILHPAAKIFS